MVLPNPIPLACPSAPRVLWRGFCGRCPNCGSGAIFKSYLKPFSACGVCAQDFTHLRADDGPAWLTILATGHIVVPFLLMAIQYDIASDRVITVGAIAIAMISALVILPRAKGLFIAALWMIGRPEKTQSS